MSLEHIIHRFTVMGGPASVQLYLESTDNRSLLKQAEAEARRLEKKYSRYRDDSLLSAINASAGVKEGIRVDAETAGLLDYAQIAFEQSEGLFDISSGVLRQAWDFKISRLPDQSHLDTLLKKVGWDKVKWQSPILFLPQGMELDFGGLVKEYAADAIVNFLRLNGAQHGMVEMAGDIGIIGPHPDGQPWKIGIRDPADPEVALATLDAFEGGLASSGNYERFMMVDGKRYCHVLNPKTGWPVSDVAGVSVHASSCIVAGTAATVAMLLGAETGDKWLAEEGFQYLLIAEKMAL